MNHGSTQSSSKSPKNLKKINLKFINQSKHKFQTKHLEQKVNIEESFEKNSI